MKCMYVLESPGIFGGCATPRRPDPSIVIAAIAISISAIYIVATVQIWNVIWSVSGIVSGIVSGSSSAASVRIVWPVGLNRLHLVVVVLRWLRSWGGKPVHNVCMYVCIKVCVCIYMRIYIYATMYTEM